MSQPTPNANEPIMSQPSPNAQKTSRNKALAIISMVCGIVAIILCWTGWFAIICAVVALVLGIIALIKKTDGKGMAIAGIVIASVGLIISATIAILAIVVVNQVSDDFDDWNSELDASYSDWSDEIDACLEENGVNPVLDYDEMTEAEQDIYFDCM